MTARSIPICPAHCAHGGTHRAPARRARRHRIRGRPPPVIATTAGPPPPSTGSTRTTSLMASQLYQSDPAARDSGDDVPDLRRDVHQRPRPVLSAAPGAVSRASLASGSAESALKRDLLYATIFRQAT